MKGRAQTNEQKRVIIERIYAAWCRSPHERLGQLLVNATGNDRESGPLFRCEDERLAEMAEGGE